jgi:S-adenosylmethionine:tRNA ribosyltransferase-isomerase
MGTFRPVKTDDPDEHEMEIERYEISGSSARVINGARPAGGRIVAVGTTSVRVLESVADSDGIVRAGAGETGLYIKPGYAYRCVDVLVTNFHLPKSTLLMLVCAFGGYENVMRAYHEAVSEGYGFYSYGDAMLLL